MNETVIIVSSLAIILSCIGLIMGCVSIAMVSGFLRSTHTVQWKTLDNPFAKEAEELLEDDDFGGTNETFIKPSKPKDYAFMEDVADQNNF